MGLLALMLLQESRRTARSTAGGDLILLEDQDRGLWNRELIAQGSALVERALSSRRFGPYSLQAAIAAVHADAKTAAETDWAEIVGLYDVLHRLEPSPVVELNRAVAVAMRDGADAGLRLVDAILARGELRDYHFAHAARAEFCRRLGRRGGTIAAIAADAALAYGARMIDSMADGAQFAGDRLEDLGDSAATTARGLRRDAAYKLDVAGDALRSSSRKAGRKSSRAYRALRTGIKH